MAKDLDLTESALLRLRCEQLEVSHSGFYAWRKRPKSARQQVDKHLAEEVKLRESQHTCQPDYWRDLAF